jgi:hypothetical protein
MTPPLLLLAAAALFNNQPPGPERCAFDVQRLSFAGSPIAQARCLLSPMLIHGEIGPPYRRLGRFLEAHVGKRARIDLGRLRALLAAEHLPALAASVETPLSRARNNDPQAPFARYFVIHDTSLELPLAEFPSNESAQANGLGWTYPDGTQVAHTFTNRRGEILFAHDYAIPWRATKRERDAITGGNAKGLFLHNELNQIRLNDPTGRPGNFDRAPVPGFTAAQYDRLALLYILASARGGHWLIPGFHGVIDSGIPDAHDDPQNFDMNAWEAALARRYAEVRRR